MQANTGLSLCEIKRHVNMFFCSRFSPLHSIPLYSYCWPFSLTLQGLVANFLYCFFDEDRTGASDIDAKARSSPGLHAMLFLAAVPSTL